VFNLFAWLDALASLKAGLGVAAVATFALIGAAVSTPAPTALATVTLAQGEVQVLQSDGGSASAWEGRALYAGDRVWTGPTGVAVITYSDGSTVALDPGSEVSIEMLETTTAGRMVVLMVQTAGRAWYTITSALSPNSRFELRTPATAAVVRAGSTVQVEVDSNGDTGITTLSGNVETIAAGAAVQVAAGQRTVVPAGSTPAPVTSALQTPVQPAPVAAETNLPSNDVEGGQESLALLPRVALPTLSASDDESSLEDESSDDDESESQDGQDSDREDDESGDASDDSDD
jgi:hypothetical protein